MSVHTGWNNLLHLHRNGSLMMPREHTVNTYNFNFHRFLSHGGRIKGCQTIFFVHSLVCKALCFGVGSGRDRVLRSAPQACVSLPLRLSPPQKRWAAAAGLARGENYPGAVLAGGLWSGNCSKSGNSSLSPEMKGFTAFRSQRLKDLVLWFQPWTQISVVSEQIQLHCVIFWLNSSGWTTSCFRIEIMRVCRGETEKKRFLFCLLHKVKR